MPADPLKAPRPSPEAPRIPGYEIESVLGRGASGVVFRARQLAVDRDVALKVLHPELSAKTRYVQRLKREARTSARLAHPHIVSAIDMGEVDGRWWYAMELVDGPSLALLLRQEGWLTERQALRTFIPLAEALVHIWEHGVVHRDVKPANVLIDRSGGARLADLGLAFADDDPGITRQGSTLGTPHYMSPEQAVDPSSADIRSDIWSFGATLFHAVCGRPPFQADSTAEVLSAVLYARVPDPLELEPSLSRGLVLVIRKCLNRDPDARYLTPRELLDDLERVRERRQPKVRRRSLDPVARMRDPRRQVLLVVAGVVLLAATFFVVRNRWGGDAEEGGGETLVESGPYRPLETLLARARRNPAHVGSYLSELDAMRVELPREYGARWSEVDEELVLLLRERLEELRDEVEGEFEAALAAHDFTRAVALLETEVGRRLLERTRYHIGDPDQRIDSLRVWLASIELQLEATRRATADDVATALRQARERTLSQVDRDVERQRWVAAEELLEVDDRTLLERAGYAAYRFPPGFLGDALSTARVSYGLERERLEDAWVEVDKELRRFVLDRTGSLRDDLRTRELSNGAVAVLRLAFEDELARLGLGREQMPRRLPSVALEAFATSEAELVRLEEDLLVEDARRAIELTERLCLSSWAARDYEAVLGLWDDCAEEIVEAGVPAESRLGEGVFRAIELRQTEAELLLGLLRRASDSVAALDGEEREVLDGSIRKEGRIEAGPDPLQDGFRLVRSDGGHESLDLRTLVSSEILALVGLATEDSALQPADRLLVALLRYRDGDALAADRTLRSGDLPREGLPGELVVDTRAGVADRLTRLQRESFDREAEARPLLECISEERIRLTPTTVLRAVETLLEEYSDVPDVRRRRSELIDVRTRLRDARAVSTVEEFERVYGADALAFVGLDRVSMVFTFERGEVGAWERRGWVPDGVGWSLEQAIGEVGDLPNQNGPRLILRAPLEVEAPDFDLTLRIEQLVESGPPRLFVITAAGFHVALAGRGLPGGDQKARWLVGTGSVDELLKALLAGEGSRVPELLREGRVHEIRLRANPRRGTLRLELDGRLLGASRTARPAPPANSIVLRSWEPVRLLEVRLEAARR